MVILFLLANNVCGCNGIEEHHCGTLGLSFSKWLTLMKSTYLSLCDLDQLLLYQKIRSNNINRLLRLQKLLFQEKSGFCERSSTCRDGAIFFNYLLRKVR